MQDLTGNKPPIFSGWAMDAYPEMDRDEIARHVDRQISLGANFVWMGHNNPGECDASKIEPGFSYAVWEALIDPHDPRHNDALEIVDAQKRLLDHCLSRNIPVVLPIGYQIQMGSRWNEVHSQSLRRHLDGKVIDWGGISACFYSPEYREDIRRFYCWINDEIISAYRPVILLVNLADEPFGGDYSHYAEMALRQSTGLGFEEALSGSPEKQALVGRFQSEYIVNYAAWSADTWHSICPGIPSTMSLCGHHGREENIMPSVSGVFRNTPSHFHPTFDVYPRDGDQATPPTDNDVRMLSLFLRQLAWLSAANGKPYWLWTTGNSWGLGQASNDPADILDAVINQVMAVASACDSGANLRGLAVWNYNVKYQGLYNDTITPVYDIEEMFSKLTRVIAHLRSFPGAVTPRTPRLAIITDPDYAHRHIAQSHATTWVRPFPLDRIAVAARAAGNILMDDSLASVVQSAATLGFALPEIIIYLSDGLTPLAEGERRALEETLLNARAALLPRSVFQNLDLKQQNPKTLLFYDGLPKDLKVGIIQDFLAAAGLSDDRLFHIMLGPLEFLYNLSGGPVALGSSVPPGAIHLNRSAKTQPSLPSILPPHESVIRGSDAAVQSFCARFQ